MKILRKGHKFQKRKDSTKADIKAIQELVNAGWSYCDRATWKREVRDNSNHKDGKADG